MDPGLIPAHAGKTAGLRGVRFRREAHPRSRGENMVRLGAYADALGSSPLTRGKLVCPRHVRPAPGLIPAHAGKTREELIKAIKARAHPRSRGENMIDLAKPQLTAGSSPLTRGKLHP